MQNLLRSMLEGTCPSVAADSITRNYLPKGKSISTGEWQVLASRAHIWLDYGKRPTIHTSQPGRETHDPHIPALCPSSNEAGVPQVGSYAVEVGETDHSDLIKAVNSIPGMVRTRFKLVTTASIATNELSSPLQHISRRPRISSR